MLDLAPGTTRLVTTLPAALVLLSACSGFGAAPSPAPPTAGPSAAAVVAPPAAQPAAATPDPELERRVADLELQVLERTAQVAELQERLDEARREVVRSMGRLQSLATRAEAASGIAEAELAQQSLPTSAPPEALAEIRELMQLSTVEFDKPNYGGALYLANQAKSAAMIARGQLAEASEGSTRPAERSLSLPVRLETTTRANVRSGPGTGFGVLFTLPEQSFVVAYASEEQWLRIADDSGRRGWISQKLIRGRP